MPVTGPTRTLRLAQAIALAMVLVVAGLVNGLQAHVIPDHHAAGPTHQAHADIASEHGHSHDDHDPGGEGRIDGASGGPHDGTHHHVIDALAAWLAPLIGPQGTLARRALARPPVRSLGDVAAPPASLLLIGALRSPRDAFRRASLTLYRKHRT